MRTTDLANRYGKALFDLAQEKNLLEKILAELRVLDEVFSKGDLIIQFLTNPLVGSDERTKLIQSSLSQSGLSQEMVDFLMLLAEKDRFSLFHEIVLAFEVQCDDANNVCRGQVRSAIVLGSSDRKQLEDTIESVLKKKVILNYTVDPSVIGGLVANVGSYTFDDSIASHLTRMSEELKRRTV